MASMTINGPIEISDDMAKLLFEAMTDMGKAAVALKFGDRLTNGPLSEKAIEAAAKIYIAKAEIPKAGAKALCEGVAAECKKLGKKSVNLEHLKIVVDEETRAAAVELVREKVGEVIASFTVADFKDLSGPVGKAVSCTVELLAQQYFLKTQDGQAKIMEILGAACDSGRENLVAKAESKLFDAIESRTDGNNRG